ncbi:MAG: glycosyltransferase family 2 protein [Pedobacter sp.]|nr:MAG: glycosyltransferase family 2 protein [Pedobacter sp.]
MAPICRIYLFTYKRNLLLQRAIESLLAQTNKNWICELHNDCPEDDFPGEYLDSIADQRFILKQHELNLGPTKSFNLAYQGCSEKYASILEDDNWWEPDFLATCITLLESRPEIPICWSNMYTWQEQTDHTWLPKHQTIWPVKNDLIFDWPDMRQALGALHSNGAMMWRSKNATKYIIPDQALFNAVELIRERSFDYPIYLIAKPLANYSFTRHTHQSKDTWEWTGVQIMMLESFLQNRTNKKDVADLCRYYFSVNYNNLLIFTLSRFRKLMPLKFKLFGQLIKYKWLLGNPGLYKRLKTYLSKQKQTEQFLIEQTEKRSFHENSDQRKLRSTFTVK